MIKYIILKNKNLDERIKSRSGGFFAAISDYFILHGGLVYGCVMIDTKNAKHIVANSFEIRDKMCGSKYIQSDISGIFKDIKDNLIKGKRILFSGTGCQNAALKSYLSDINQENLLCIEIICHGVASHLVWGDLIDSYEKKRKKKIVKVDFRNKYKFGWNNHVESFYFEDGNEIDSTIFRDLFSSNLIERPCCYSCPFKKIESKKADLIIGDAWGKFSDNFNDDNGVSLVICKTDKASFYFDKIKDKVIFEKCQIQNFSQESLIRPNAEPSNRSIFWKVYLKKGIWKAYCYEKKKEKIQLVFQKIKDIF
jgi:hypothetical protein